MLNPQDYNSLCNDLAITKPNWNSYISCRKHYNNYLNTALSYSSGARKAVFLFLESCPKDTSDYIFTAPSVKILSKNKSYLYRIYTGFYDKNKISATKTKKECLSDLLNYQSSSQNEKIPVILFDLFPLHGIELNPKIRQNICSKIISNRFLIHDVISDISQFKSIEVKLFLFGVPYTIWNLAGGYGPGSIYTTSNLSSSGPLGNFDNTSAIINMGGQNLSSSLINAWRKKEGID